MVCYSTKAVDVSGILNMVCNTAVNDGLLERNPCMIVGAMYTKAKENVKIPSTT